MKRAFSLFLSILTVAVLLFPFPAASATPTQAAPKAPVQQPPPPEATQKAPELPPPPPETAKQAPESPPPPAVSSEEALAKLHPDLRELARTAGPALPATMGMLSGPAREPVIVEVFAAAGADVSGYFVDGKAIVRPMLGKGDQKSQIFIGFMQPSNLLKVASQTAVEAIIPIVLEKNAEPEPYPADEPRVTQPKGPEDWAKLRANAEKVRAGWLPWEQARAFGDGRAEMRPQDWFEVLPQGPHQAQDAWNRGYKGEGVTVAVLDDGIDPAHPDLLGTQKIYSSTVTPAYNGWPYVFSPLSMLLYAFDEVFGTTFIADGFSGAHYVDTSLKPTLTPCGAGLLCFKYTPLIDYGVAGFEHTYIISATMTKSGVVHVGTHPDNDLRDYLWGEKVSILVADPHTAGVYDTVYVDLDDDYDFRDEKPLTRADVNNPATYNNMIAYRDVNGDGLADISGGMVYFIGDGATPLPASDWMYGGLTPGNGDLVAISGSTFDRSYSHGTQCASNIVGQGVADAMLPDFSDLTAKGKPAGAVYGMAPDAKVVNISDIYINHEPSTIDAYLFAAVGYDACDQTGYDLNTNGACSDSDAIQIATNSYGASDEDNDGWDYRGQVASQVQRLYGPSLQFLFSTGNGAPAYGTAAPPSPATGIAVGASTEFGSTGWDSITSTTQILANDVIPFSNRGPSARGTNGVDVVAGGAYAAGDEELNYYSVSTWGAPDGNSSWVSWGGTSRSAPVAGGVLALIYQAYKEANGDWPTYDVAKAIFKASATDLNYDTFTQGSGSVNADRGTAVAGGHYGIFALPDEWDPGDYRGDDYPGFAHIAYPGDTFTQTVTVYNPGVQAITAPVAAEELKLVGSEEFNYTVTPQMIAAESAYGAANRDNFYKAFNFFIPITATAGVDNAWYNVDIPAGTDLMIVRQIFPYSQFDVNGDYTWDQRYYLTVYNWKDVNGDGNLWEDKNHNGVVNFINDPNVTLIDYGSELLWNDSRTELDRWEFNRFGYSRPGGNTYELWVHDPVERMEDGLFIGVRHLYNSQATNITTTLQYRIEFYQKQAVPWLTTNAASVVVPADGAATFVVTATVPNDMPAGLYQAGLYLTDPGATIGTEQYEANTTVIPVVLNVAANFTAGVQLGGAASVAYDADRLYNNGVVRGFFDWTWRAESGDWRFFFTDIPDGAYPAGTKVLVKDEWQDAAPHTDIDTIVLGPTATSLGDGWYDGPEPDYYGPYVLDTVGKSPNTNSSAGIWQFNTSSGVNEDWVAAPLKDGLHAFLQHNVLFEGDKFDVVFTKTVGTLLEDIHSFSIDTYLNAGLVGTATVTATLPLNSLQTQGFLIIPQVTQFTDEPLAFTGEGTIEWTYVFTVTQAYYVELATTSANISDLDLVLYRWTGTAWQQIASSAGSSASEFIYVAKPADGRYMVGIDNYSGPAGTFNLTIGMGLNAGGITVTGGTTAPVPANTPLPLGIRYNYPMEPGQCYDGLVLAGPPEAPDLKEIPLTICRKAATAGIEKAVNYATAFPGTVLTYTLNLYNRSDPTGDFQLTDPIPANTEFVAVTTLFHPCPASLNPGPVLYTQNFDGVTAPNLPADWAQVDVSGTAGNWASATATAHPSGQPPHSAPNLVYFNSYTVSENNSTRLYRTVGLDLSGASNPRLYFWMYHDIGYSSSGDRVQVQVSTDGGTTWEDVGAPIPRYDGSTGWKEHFVDLSAFAGANNVRIGFLGISGYGNDCHIDDVRVQDYSCPAPGATYDSLQNAVVYHGPIVPVVSGGAEGFEGGVMPPSGYTTRHLGTTTRRWTLVNAGTYPQFVHSGNWAAWVNYDDTSSSNEWLYTPVFKPTAADHQATFWAYSDTLYPGATMKVWAVKAGGAMDLLWDLIADENWATAAYRLVTLDLSAYVDQPIQLAWQYVGQDGDSFGLDDIYVPLTALSGATVEITVRVTDTVAPGTWITNTASLAASHALPQETQVEPAVTASAVSRIGQEDFATSYKEVPAQVVAGENFVYKIHVINSGDKLASATFTDTLPSGVTYVSHSASNNTPYFTYDSGQKQVAWSGHVGPGDELVFSVTVKAGTSSALWGTTVTNTAYLSWGSTRIPLVAATRIRAPYQIYLPLTLRNVGP